MVSLPRDATVRLAPNEQGIRRTKLNAAHSYGGPQLLIQTLHDELGLTIHHHAVIKFDGFKALIDQVGGIEVNVEGALKRDPKTGKMYRGNLDYKDNYGNWEVHLKPGVQTLTGEQAHGYVRFRMDLEGDPGRIRRQQSVMRALAKEIMQSSPFEIPGLSKSSRNSLKLISPISNFSPPVSSHAIWATLPRFSP
jgi:LCP family protein required for cell wall assembly